MVLSNSKMTKPLGKLISYLLLTIGGGLLQLWVLSLILVNQGKEVTLEKLLGDGGLLFFSTSLLSTSFLALLEVKSLKLGTAPLNISVALGLPITIATVVLYTSCLKDISCPPALPLRDHVLEQIICASGSLIYALYVCTTSKFFWSDAAS